MTLFGSTELKIARNPQAEHLNQSSSAEIWGFIKHNTSQIVNRKYIPIDTGIYGTYLCLPFKTGNVETVKNLGSFLRTIIIPMPFQYPQNPLQSAVSVTEYLSPFPHVSQTTHHKSEVFLKHTHRNRLGWN